MKKLFGLFLLLILFQLHSQEIESWQFTWNYFKMDDYSIEIIKTEDTLFARLGSDYDYEKISASETLIIAEGLKKAEIELNRMASDKVEAEKTLPLTAEISLNCKYSPKDGKRIYFFYDTMFSSFTIDPKLIKYIVPALLGVPDAIKLIDQKIKLD